MLSFDQSKPAWMSLSDLMAVLMVVFLFTSIAFVFELQQQRAVQEALRQNYQQALHEALKREFSDDLPRWSAMITEDNIVRFDAPFGIGQANLPPEFEQILSEFFPRYLGVLTDQDFKNNLQGIQIEGHTSNTWAQASEPQEVYLNNMRLSQQRASNVLEFVYRIQHSTVVDLHPWLERHLRAKGMAYAAPLYVPGTQQIDSVRSRRVEFKVVTQDRIYIATTDPIH